MAAKPKVVKDVTLVEEKTYKCVKCGAEYTKADGHFFKSPSSDVYKDNDKYCPICKKCLDAKFETFKKRYDEKTAMLLTCHYLDIPFYYSLYDSIIKNTDGFTIGLYLRQMNNKQYMGKTFVNTLLDKKELGITEESFEEIKEEKWSASDTRNKKNTIDIVGYDPFEGYTESDRHFLFNDIIKYLDEDGIEDDQFKISQIIQLVNNNRQIQKLDTAIAKLDPAIDSISFKELKDVKKDLVSSNDKIAKENGISVKNRLDREAGRSTLTYLMKDLRLKNFENAEANYYKQLQSAGTRWAADISFKSIKENGFFDENDYNDIMENQYKQITELQKKLDNVEEENRLLLIENDELKAGDKNG